MYNTLLKRSALPVDRPFPSKDGVPLALNHPKEIFRKGVTISYARSGDFGREFLRKQPGSTVTEMRIGPDAVEELFHLLYSQFRSDAAAEAHNCVEGNNYKRRKRASNWFIDASDHLGGGDIIWDKRVYLD
jgi:hypothetical protein